MILELTEKEVDLLREILVCINQKTDWIENDDNSLVKARVLLHKDENNLEIVNGIYNKLFE